MSIHLLENRQIVKHPRCYIDLRQIQTGFFEYNHNFVLGFITPNLISLFDTERTEAKDSGITAHKGLKIFLLGP